MRLTCQSQAYLLQNMKTSHCDTHFTSPLHCSQLILRKDNVGSHRYQAPLLGSESGRTLGILPTANLQRH